ncbi:unnamed protein product, partial [Mesorhabditis spiculigera]
MKSGARPRRVHVFWNFLTAPLPLEQVEDFLLKLHVQAGHPNEMELAFYCDARTTDPGVLNIIEQRTSATMLHTRAQLAVERICRAMERLSDDEDPGLIVLISDSDSYSRTLTQLARKYWKLQIVHPADADPAFRDYADHAYTITEVLLGGGGGEDDWKEKKKSKNADDYHVEMEEELQLKTALPIHVSRCFLLQASALSVSILWQLLSPDQFLAHFNEATRVAFIVIGGGSADFMTNSLEMLIQRVRVASKKALRVVRPPPNGESSSMSWPSTGQGAVRKPEEATGWPDITTSSSEGSCEDLGVNYRPSPFGGNGFENKKGFPSNPWLSDVTNTSPNNYNPAASGTRIDEFDGMPLNPAANAFNVDSGKGPNFGYGMGAGGPGMGGFGAAKPPPLHNNNMGGFGGGIGSGFGGGLGTGCASNGPIGMGGCNGFGGGLGSGIATNTPPPPAPFGGHNPFASEEGYRRRVQQRRRNQQDPVAPKVDHRNPNGHHQKIIVTPGAVKKQDDYAIIQQQPPARPQRNKPTATIAPLMPAPPPTVTTIVTPPVAAQPQQQQQMPPPPPSPLYQPNGASGETVPPQRIQQPNGLEFTREPFRKPAPQCVLWEQKHHRNETGCTLWHPRQTCRFYPHCAHEANNCGFGHPFCGGKCYCDPVDRDPQLNHWTDEMQRVLGHRNQQPTLGDFMPIPSGP